MLQQVNPVKKIKQIKLLKKDNITSKMKNKKENIEEIDKEIFQKKI